MPWSRLRHSDGPVVTVTGTPAELTMWTMPRTAAMLRLDGNDSDIGALPTSKLAALIRHHRDVEQPSLLPGHLERTGVHSPFGTGGLPDTSTGSGRIVSPTRLPAGSFDASEVGSWARIVVSPRSTVTRLVAPKNVVAITVPTSGPGSPELSEDSVTASGRTRAVTGPSWVDRSTSGRSWPRTVTVPPLTVPASRLLRPTNSATNGVAGRE
jgi:hypothetical protein